MAVLKISSIRAILIKSHFPSPISLLVILFVIELYLHVIIEVALGIC